MPTSNNSSDEHEKSMCESDAYDVSVTEHTTPLPTGEGAAGGGVGGRALWGLWPLWGRVFAFHPPQILGLSCFSWHSGRHHQQHNAA